MNLIFIRHGDPDYSIDSLTEKGWREAELLSARTTKWNVKEFYCSPLGRAKDTASFTLNKLNRTATIHDWLKEFFVPVKDPETGNDRIPWDFMPNYWTKEENFYHKDTWYKAPVMQTGNIEAEFSKVKEGIDTLLAEHGYVRNGNYYKVVQGNHDTLLVPPDRRTGHHQIEGDLRQQRTDHQPQSILLPVPGMMESLHQ